MTIGDSLRALHQDGFVLMPAVLDAEQIADLRHAIDQLKPQHWDYSGVIDHYKCVFNRNPFWLPFLEVAGVIELAEAALGDDCHVIGQTAWRCHPGFKGAPLHLDYLAMKLPPTLLADPAFELPMQVFTAQFYLDDIDADLSPTQVIPGSHKAGRAPVAGEAQWQGRSAQPVLCRAGDVLTLRSELWHAGSAAPPTAPATCSKCIMAGGWSHRSFHPICTGSSTLRCWPRRHLASGGYWVITRKLNTIEAGSVRSIHH